MKIKKLSAYIIPVILFAALCYFFYGARDTEVYGHKLSADRRSISFEGGEIKDLPDLLDELEQFRSLKKVDLGDYEIDVKDIPQIEKRYPDVEFVYDSYVVLYDERFPSVTEELDISDKTIDGIEEIEEALPYFPSLKTVLFGDNVIPHEDKAELEEEFPGVEFDVIAAYTVCGIQIPDTETKIDLAGLEITDSIADELSVFPELESVDLRGCALDAALQRKLLDKYPGVDFTWEIDFGGARFDSKAEEIDLSESEGVTAEMIRERLPLFVNLKRADLTGCVASNEEMAAIREDFPDIKVVWTLYMGKWSLKTDATAFSVLIYDYTHTRLTSSDIEVLKYTTNLCALDLGHQAITDLTTIGNLKDLRVLILADNAVSDLSPLANLKHLHYLELFVNWLTNVTPLGELKEMVDLNISYNWITDIHALYEFPMLERFWLESTNVSEEDVKRLEETYPNAKIVREGEGSVDQGWRTHYRYWAMMDMWFNDYLSEAFSKYDR